MFNVDMVLDILNQILEASNRVLNRFEPIDKITDGELLS